jgi:hypothetical protein
MCTALLSGHALTATELASFAGVGKATASEHLQQLIGGGIITAISQGRHRYHRLASAEVADVIEGLARLAPPLPIRSLRHSKTAIALANARTCYNHIAGRLGVELYEGMLAVSAITMRDGGLGIGENLQIYCALGIDTSSLKANSQALLRECLDWTERRSHLAGRVASELLTATLAARWITLTPRPRALNLTDTGERMLTELGILNLTVKDLKQSPGHAGVSGG